MGQLSDCSAPDTQVAGQSVLDNVWDSSDPILPGRKENSPFSGPCGMLLPGPNEMGP